MKRRLKVETEIAAANAEAAPKKNASAVREKAAKTAQEFYSKSDPENVARLRMKLIQAGYMDPRAVGTFFLIRFGGFVGFALGAVLCRPLGGQRRCSIDEPLGLHHAWRAPPAISCRASCWPNWSRQDARIPQRLSRFHGPDDRLLGCRHEHGGRHRAGLEGAGLTYPSLSQNLQLVSLEFRAGRSLDDALKSLADRLSLDEVRSFATLLQQSKELGTSLSGALRVFSDEMRHKRMSMAEEKAHALPAKMSVPVTVCILPVVMMIAIIPIIVKMTAGPDGDSW